MKKNFWKINLTWKKIIIFAVLIAMYTALMAIVPITANTSFRDIAINFEWWILFGVLIIVNSKSPLDSALKCFVFFLISQPLIYLFQVPFSDKGFALFDYYKYWFIWTILTLPMGYIGYYIKNNNIFSSIILVPMLLILTITGFDYFGEMCINFPNHLLSFISCFAIILIIVFNVLKNYKLRIISIILTIFISIIYLLSSKESQQVRYEIQKDLTEYNIVLYGNVDVTQLIGNSFGEVYINCDEDGSCKLKLIGTIGDKYSFVLKDEKNNEYSFEYQYTDEDGMKLNLND